MGNYVNHGNSSFTSARKSQIYIDKTGLLDYTNAVIDTEQRYLCVSKPRRFGKTLTAGMLMAYYCQECASEALFCDLAIAKSPTFREHLNQYDVSTSILPTCLYRSGIPRKPFPICRSISSKS